MSVKHLRRQRYTLEAEGNLLQWEYNSLKKENGKLQQTVEDMTEAINKLTRERDTLLATLSASSKQKAKKKAMHPDPDASRTTPPMKMLPEAYALVSDSNVAGRIATRDSKQHQRQALRRTMPRGLLGALNVQYQARLPQHDEINTNVSGEEDRMLAYRSGSSTAALASPSESHQNPSVKKMAPRPTVEDDAQDDGHEMPNQGEKVQNNQGAQTSASAESRLLLSQKPSLSSSQPYKHVFPVPNSPRSKGKDHHSQKPNKRFGLPTPGVFVRPGLVVRITRCREKIKTSEEGTETVSSSENTLSVGKEEQNDDASSTKAELGVDDLESLSGLSAHEEKRA